MQVPRSTGDYDLDKRAFLDIYSRLTPAQKKRHTQLFKLIEQTEVDENIPLADDDERRIGVKLELLDMVVNPERFPDAAVEILRIRQEFDIGDM